MYKFEFFYLFLLNINDTEDGQKREQHPIEYIFRAYQGLDGDFFGEHSSSPISQDWKC